VQALIEVLSIALMRALIERLLAKMSLKLVY